MASVSWLHLSDWHQRVSASRVERHERRKVVVEILRDIKRMIATRRTCGIDFIVFSGDIANSGSNGEYAEALPSLLLPLFRFTGVSPSHCFVVAGNHDLDRQSLASLPPHLLAPLNPLTFDTVCADGWVSSPVDYAALRKPFDEFRNFAAAFRPNADWAYSETFSTSDGTAVEIVALNSALFCGRKGSSGQAQDYGGLFVGDRQLALMPASSAPRLDTSRRRLRIATLHHPFPWFYQAEQVRLQETLLGRVNFVLVGHEHNQRVEEIVTNYGDVVIIPAGPCYDRQAAISSTPDRYAMAYNVIRLDNDGSGWTGRAWLRRWHSQTRRFHADTRYPTLPGGSYPLRCLGMPSVNHWNPPQGGVHASLRP